MIEQFRGIDVLTDLLVYIDKELLDRGWSGAELARRGGFQRQTISRWRVNPESKAEVETLNGIAEAFEVPLAKILILYGVDPGMITMTFDEVRLAVLLESMPEAPKVIEIMRQMPLEKRQAVWAYVQWQAEQQGTQKPDPGH